MGYNPYEGVDGELAGSAFAAIRYVEETGSTNADAVALLGDERFDGLTIVAEHQTQGSGRKGRSWIDAPGSALLCTTILPGIVASPHLWIATFWTGLAIRAALLEHGVDAALVWPNDLVLARGKVAGILCASRVSGDEARVACGVGINVKRGTEPLEVDAAAAYCDDVVAVDRASLLRSILLQYDATRSLLDNPQRVARLWEVHAGLPGRRYHILKDGDAAAFEATALGLATGGGLVVRRDAAARETISLADARVLR